MTVTVATPRPERLDVPADAGLEVDRLLGHVRSTERRLIWALGLVSRPGGDTPLARAYLRRVADDYEEALGLVRIARRESGAFSRID